MLGYDAYTVESCSDASESRRVGQYGFPMYASEVSARWAARQLLFVCVAMRCRRACCSVESGMRLLLVGNRRTVSKVGQVLRRYGPGCSALFRSSECWPGGGGGVRWKSCKLYGKVWRS
jgi:hypothetical protein